MEAIVRTQTLSTLVGAALSSEPELDAGAITVMNDGCVVTLGGSVDSLAQRIAAQKAALRADGVHGLAMDIEIRRPGEEDFSDGAIARDAVDCLERDKIVAGAKIQDIVDDGILTLSGRVQHAWQRLAASSAVHEAHGLLGVINDIIVSPPIGASRRPAPYPGRSAITRAWPAPGDYGRSTTS
jgi:osmotically-inducible protein OsmY